MVAPSTKSPDLRELIARLEVEFGRLDERMMQYSKTLGESMQLIKDINKDTNQRIDNLAEEIRASRHASESSVRLLDEKVNQEKTRTNGLEERISCLEKYQLEHEQEHEQAAERQVLATQEAKKGVQERRKFLWEKEISLKHALILTVGTLFITGFLNLLFEWLKKLIIP